MPENYTPGLPKSLAELQAAVRKRILPRPADTDPVLGRAIGRAKKKFGPELSIADIKAMPWESNLATSNILGQTRPDNTIRMNPTMMGVFPEIDTDRILAHELTHIKQFNDPSSPFSKYEYLLPYEERPSENQASKEARKYIGGLPEEYKLENRRFDDRLDMSILNGIPKMFKKAYY